MTDQLKKCLVIFDQAIKFEETGMAFFEERAAKAESALERNLFHALAKDELGHKKYLLQLRDELLRENDLEAMSPVSGQHATAREIFESAMSGAQDPYEYESDQLRILDGAMDVERKGYTLYINAVNSVESPRAKAVFQHLAGEEQKHYNLLKNTYDYMADPEAWHGFDESPMLDGG